MTTFAHSTIILYVFFQLERFEDAICSLVCLSKDDAMWPGGGGYPKMQ